ncbi:hypothetical protein HDU82_008620 [Entophlyctis luteolus]|nr:hypothetical protein HDU82_008620 [Entophlyctis luteolus]
MAATVPSTAQALSLYRSLLRAARLYSNYNFRNYVARRATDSFREFQHATDPEVLSRAYAKGIAELGVAQRQGTIDGMYRSQRLVVEKTDRPFGYNVYRN